jgi:hypothetical protein
LIAAIAIGVLAFVWKTYYGKIIFFLVLIGILLSAIFRIAFFGAAIAGGSLSLQKMINFFFKNTILKKTCSAERGRLTFVILDKIAVVWFTWALLGFVYM